MRFCMLTTFYPPWSFGGDGIQVERLSRALAERGHDVTVVHSAEAYRTLARTKPAPAEHPGLRVVPIDAGTGPLSPLATYLSGRPLLAGRKLREVLAEPFDVLHFHNPSLLGGPALLGMGRGLRLYTAHEQWLVCPTHVLWKYRRRVCEKPDCVRCTLSYRRPPQPWRYTGLLDRSVAGLDALIAPSETTARLHARFEPLVRVERIGHFLPQPPEETAEANGGRPYFLYAGRLEPVKGVTELAEAFRGRPEELLIAGDGSLEERLRRDAPPNVRLLGRLGSERLGPLYRGALALVLPTLGHESFPLVMLEAFARGVPVVARRFGAQAELLGQSGGGLAYGSEDELQAALDRLAADPALRSGLGAHGRAAWQEHWTPEAHLDRYLGLIEALRTSRGSSRTPAAAEPGARRSAESP